MRDASFKWIFSSVCQSVCPSGHNLFKTTLVTSCVSSSIIEPCGLVSTYHYVPFYHYYQQTQTHTHKHTYTHTHKHKHTNPQWSMLNAVSCVPCVPTCPHTSKECPFEAFFDNYTLKENRKNLLGLPKICVSAVTLSDFITPEQI